MKKKILTHLLLFIITSPSLAQEIIKKGAHEQQLIEFGYTKKTASKFNRNGDDIIPLKATKTKSLLKKIVGFLPYWEYTNNAHDNIHYDLLTHIAVFDFTTSSTGTLTVPSAWPWTDVINAAHTEGTKVIMTVTNFTASDIHTILTNSTSKNNLFNNIKNMIANYQLDGVNIDFESINTSDRGSLLNSFMQNLTNYIHTNLPSKEVSFDSPAVNWGGWDLNGLTQSVDYLFIMTYDYNGAWSSYTGAVAPLTHPSNGICVNKSLTDDYSLPIANFPEKLILGVPYYGKHWETASSSPGAAVTNYVGSTLYRNTDDEETTHGGYIWDNNSQTPWYNWFSGNWNQVWADNEQSLGLKYDLAIDKSLGGIGMWALNYDGNKSELWELISTKFNTTLAVEDNIIQHIKIYPNPAKTYLYISNPLKITINSIELFNIYGQKIRNYNPRNNTIDIQDLKNAVYFIRFKNENGNASSFKIIKS